MQGGQGLVHRRVVLLHHRLALPGVGLVNGFLDLRNRLLARQHVGNGEEARLHDGVDAAAHAGGLGHGIGVNHITFQFLGDDLALGLHGELVPHLLRAVRAN